MNDKIKIPHQNLLRRMAKRKNDEFNRLKKENAELKKKLDMMGKPTSDMKAKFIGEYKITETFFEDDGRIEYDRDFVIPWTLQKQIFKDMCEYVKNRDPKDFRP